MSDESTDIVDITHFKFIAMHPQKLPVANPSSGKFEAIWQECIPAMSC